MERNMLNEKDSALVFKGVCPNCKSTLYEGPHGGLAINAICENCNAVIWMVPGVPGFGAEWIKEGDSSKYCNFDEKLSWFKKLVMKIKKGEKK